jgi:uncharacterized membrane protein
LPIAKGNNQLYDNPKGRDLCLLKSGHVRKIVFSGLVMAIYIALMYFTQGFAFLQWQVRIATGLYAMAAVYPWLVIPLGLANMLSNILMGGLGAADILGGLAAGLMTSFACALLGKKRSVFIKVIPIAVIPSLLVPIWLAFLLGVPYYLLVLSLFVGQAISAYTLGILLLKLDWSKISQIK